MSTTESMQEGRRSLTGNLMRIGEVAKTVGLSLRSVRFYEEAGLVEPVTRSAGGYRLYDDDCIQRFRTIMRMKPLGFTVEEMRMLIGIENSLRSPDLSETERSELIGRRTMFAVAATEKVRSLREQLLIAEDFSEQLSREIG